MKTALVLVFWLLSNSLCAAEQCAENYKELDKTPRLSAIKNLFTQDTTVGFVNKTQGSYFFLQLQQDQFIVKFYTSGFLDIYGISRSSSVRFCDEGDALFLVGLGQKELVQFSGDQLILGKGGPRKSFTPGEMPALLKKLHHFEDHKTASIP